MRAIKNPSLSLRVAAAAVAFGGMLASLHAQTPIPWTVTWSVPPQQAPLLSSGFNNLSQQTLRQILHTSISGSSVRVEISNVFGNTPIVVSDVHVANAVVNSDGSPTSSTIAGTDHAVTFSGSSTVTIPAGQIAESDGVGFTLPADADVMVSMYFPNGVPESSIPTFAQDGGQNGMFLANGDVSAATSISPYSTFSSYYYLTGLQVQNPNSLGTVVALGASITAGDKSNFNVNHRWVNDLAQRLNTAGLQVGVANKGISGNGLLSGSNANPDAISRFTRDVLQQPNVRWVIFSDVIINTLSGAGTPPTFASITSAVKQLMQQAHAQGIKFYCSTLTPNGGRPADQWTPAAEAIREQVDAFFLNPANGCDGIVDQDTATHDPANPLQYRPAFNAGDFLHPNDAGHQAIANAVNLGLFTANGVPPFTASTGCGTLLAGQGITPGHPLPSCNGRFQISLQGDGNLILYDGNTMVWSTQSSGHTPSVATLLADGNFVILDQAGKIFWSTATAGLLGDTLIMQNDGNLVLYTAPTAPNSPVWDSNTVAASKLLMY